MTQLINKMKTAVISVSMLVLATSFASSVMTQSARADWQTTTITPSLGGGFNMNSFGSNGSYFGSATPSLGGGYNYSITGPSGSTFGSITPNLGGGYSIFENRW